VQLQGESAVMWRCADGKCLHAPPISNFHIICLEIGAERREILTESLVFATESLENRSNLTRNRVKKNFCRNFWRDEKSTQICHDRVKKISHSKVLERASAARAIGDFAKNVNGSVALRSGEKQTRRSGKLKREHGI